MSLYMVTVEDDGVIIEWSELYRNLDNAKKEQLQQKGYFPDCVVTIVTKNVID